MFFDEISDIPRIAEKAGCAIFAVPDSVQIDIKNAILLEPEGKATISIEQVRDVINSFSTKQFEAQFVVIRPAEKLSEAAENAILKSLEEPEENVHYLLITMQPHRLLTTILSRAGMYVWRGGVESFDKINVDDKIKALSLELLAAKPGELVDFAEKMTKSKDGARAKTLEVLAAAIEICYKTYFSTGKNAYLKKARKLIFAYDNILANGQIKIHLVADLI